MNKEVKYNYYDCVREEFIYYVKARKPVGKLNHGEGKKIAQELIALWEAYGSCANDRYLAERCLFRNTGLLAAAINEKGGSVPEGAEMQDLAIRRYLMENHWFDWMLVYNDNIK